MLITFALDSRGDKKLVYMRYNRQYSTDFKDIIIYMYIYIYIYIYINTYIYIYLYIYIYR